MIVYDIVQIVGPTTTSSFPPNSRTLVEHHNKESIANTRCGLFNTYCIKEDCHYEVEEHNEESTLRAMPVK